MRLKDILKESTEASDIIKDLDKVRTDLIKKVDVLIAKKKKLYSDVDITTPMSADEKKLDKDIQDIFSQIQQIIQQKRKIKNESVTEAKAYKKGDKLKIKLPNGKKFDVVFDSYSRTNGVAMGKFKDDSGEYDTKPFNLDNVVESVNEAGMHPVKKVVNSILKKHNVQAMKTTSTSVRGFHNIQNGGYRWQSDYFLDFYNVPQDVIEKVGAEMKKAGVKGVDVKKGIISGDFTKNGLSEQSFFKDSVNEGRGIKSIQNDLDKTVIAIESEIASYKATKGTPQEKKHIDNLKKLHPIKKKLQAELDMAVSGLYRDAELKIED